jgi:predicted PhzF superfamily epimerase YddE/YHI9
MQSYRAPPLQESCVIYDVFAQRPFGGNQAAVVREGGRRFSNRQLLALAGELCLPETALSSRRGRDLVFRFANADRLLVRCGHASLAAVADHVLRIAERRRAGHGEWAGQYRVGDAVGRWWACAARRRGRCGVAPSVDVAIAWPDRPERVGPLSARLVYPALGLEPADRQPELPLCVYDSGNLNALVPVRTLTSLERARPQWPKLDRLFKTYGLTDVHVYCLLPSRRPVRLRCRNVFPYGVFEETATGTASVAVAAALIDHLPLLRRRKRSTCFVFDQGLWDRRGKICVRWCPGPRNTVTIWLAGRVFPVLTGHLVSVPPR